MLFRSWTNVGLFLKFSPYFTRFSLKRMLILQLLFKYAITRVAYFFIPLLLSSQIIRYFEIIFFELLNITIFCYIFLKVWENNHLPYALVTYWLPFLIYSKYDF